MGQETSSCAPISDIPIISCVKKDDNLTDEQKAKAEFEQLQGNRNGIKSENYLNDLSEENTKAITTAHLIGNIIKNYFESLDNICDHKYSKKPGIDSKAILDNILIIGCAPRNYLLKRPINSIDIAVNTRELTKLHLLHLKKYHQTEKSQKSNSQCILWRMYLNKFMTENKEKKEKKENNDDDEKTKKRYEYIADCNYILNAYFIVDYILKQHISSSLRDKLSIHRDTKTKVYQCQIIDEILYPRYDSYDLDGQYFSIFDITDKFIVNKQLFGTISTQQRLNKYVSIHSKHRLKLAEIKRASTLSSAISSVSDYETLDVVNTNKRGHQPMPSESSVSMSFSIGGSEFRSPNNNHIQRIDSLPIFAFRINDQPMIISNKNKGRINKNITNKNLINIELPFYEVKFGEVMKLMDLSINTLSVKLSDILGMNPNKNKKKNKSNINMIKDHSFENFEEEEDEDEYNDGIYNDDVIISYDWTKKLKNSLDGYNALTDYKKKLLTHPYPTNAIKCHGPDVYFWKIIRYSVLLSSWKIDKKLILICKKNYHLWLMDDTYWNKDSNWFYNKKMKNYQVFVDMMFNQNICYNNSIKQFKRMLSVFSMFEIHSKLISIMSKNIDFTNCFIKTLNDLKIHNKTDIIGLFSKQGYVTSM